MKECNVCHVSKPPEDFPKSKLNRGGRVPRCKACVSAYGRQRYAANPAKIQEINHSWAERNPTKARTSSLKARFGITAETYDAMLASQGGVCAVCKQPETRSTTGTTMALAVDHDHATGKLRALLCNRCNIVLGGVQDNPLLLEAMIVYIDKYT